MPARNGSSVSSYWVTFFAFTHAVRGSDRRGSRRPRPSIRQMAGEASRTRRAVVGGEDDAATASTTTPAPASPIAVAGDTSPRVPGTAPGTLAWRAGGTYAPSPRSTVGEFERGERVPVPAAVRPQPGSAAWLAPGSRTQEGRATRGCAYRILLLQNTRARTRSAS